MKGNWRRKNYFIKKDLQGKFIFHFFLIVIAASLFFSLILGFLSSDTLTIAYRNYHLQLGQTPIVLLKQAVRAYWIFILSGGLLAALASMFLSHRYAGPLYRLEKSLEQMNRGIFDFEIRLRSKDEAKELARMINDFNTGLSLQLSELRILSEKIGRRLADARNNPANGDSAAVFDEMADLNDKIGEILHRFTLKTNQ